MQTPPKAVADDIPYFLLHARHGYIFPDRRFLNAVSPGRRVVTMDLPGLRDGQRTPTTIAAMAWVHADRIMKENPEGPVFLAGFCTGWTIATEVANLLIAEGRHPVKLVLFDPDSPSVHYVRYRREAEGLGLPGTRTFRARRLLGLRLFDNSWQGEFNDRVHYWRLVIQHWLKGPEGVQDHRKWMARFRSHGMRRWSRAKLIAAYRTHWPTPCRAEVHLVTSRYHFSHRRYGGDFWLWALPGYSETRVAEKHKDVNGARGYEAATEMVRFFEGSGQPED